MAATRKSQYQKLLADGVPEEEARSQVYGEGDMVADDAADDQAAEDMAAAAKKVDPKAATKGDLASPGFARLTDHGKLHFDRLVLRPGEVVAGGVEVAPLDDPDRHIELYAGDTVPQGAAGYLPTNYLVTRDRQMAAARAAEAAAGNPQPE